MRQIKMTEEEFFLMLEEDFAITKFDDIYEQKLVDLNLDSLDFAQMKYLLEGKANLKFSPEDEKNLPNITVSQLLARLELCNS